MLDQHEDKRTRPDAISVIYEARVFSVAALFAMVTAGSAADNDDRGRGAQLTLPVAEVIERHPPYADFCRRQPRECDLSGARVIPFSTDLMRRLNDVNLSVNGEIRFALDADQYGTEEYWALPTSGYGDCEDLALEKRSRLAAAGLPRGALRLALVYHQRRLDAHCVLTVETSAGTYLLDSFVNEVHRWDNTAYNYEARERTDGLWDRFDQTDWTYTN